ncbi:transcriptional regulator [Polaribacter filamentus]|uniref:Transcriptional regulator n=1 Tax=Polaribacter filamentus TaxID=53483 RepID=A0A2S7KYV6_9FLAO|nr:transcriptional regulator [Polaribacter filamentus]PQB07658.1 transcriptional regulator [Polaribacter filamentus]
MRKLLKSNINIILLSILFISTDLVAQYTPYFKNYNVSDYNAGNQNWDISKSENGKIYVANNNGLLEFDGIKWTLWELPNKTIIRSVLSHNNKIYTGSYKEFGFWSKNEKGLLEYFSLSKKLKDEISSNEEIWQIEAYNNSIIFRSFGNVYIHENGDTKKYNLPSTIISCNFIDGNLYASTLNAGIFIKKNNEFIPFINNPVFNNTKIIAISNFNGGFLISTSLKGCYFLKNGTLSIYKSEINTILKKHQLNSFLKLKNDDMVFGTIKNGVYITNKNGKVLYNINKEKGLLNNTVLGMSLDSNNELWVSLDQGLSSISFDNVFTFYNDISGKLGAVYDVVLYKDVIYIGSNTGVYYLNSKNELEFIEGSQGQVWDLDVINGELFCGHNNGTYIIENNKLKMVSSETGGWTLKKVPESDDTYIQGTYSGLVKFKKIKNNWQVKHLNKTTSPIKHLVFESNNTAWAADAYKGLYRVTFNEDYESIKNIQEYNAKGLSSDYGIQVYNLNNNIVFKTNKGWQKYESILDSIIDYPLLNQTFGKDSYIISEPNTEKLALKNNRLINFFSLSTFENTISIPNKYLENRFIVDNENVSILKDSLYTLSLMNGFLIINAQKKQVSTDLEKPNIESIIVDKTRINISNASPIEIPLNKNNLEISLSAPKSENYFFEYTFENSDSAIWNKIDKEKLELSNLTDGSYTLLVRTTNFLNKHSETNRIKLKILPPWYKSKIGFFLYAGILLFILVLFFILHKRKINKEQKTLEQKYQKEQEKLVKEQVIENDKQLIKLKNAALKNELKLKSKQLANTAMALVKKNESLLILKEELLLNKNSFENSYSFRKLVKKIDSSIGGDDEWEIFEYNFNQVHEEFFSSLSAVFPMLSKKDLKTSAYIKMNLSTKEIALLMNISVRGVETMRYRLKKKLNLQNDNSLVDYLLNFKNIPS